jgi:branched-chain amino acid transport system permease protein
MLAVVQSLVNGVVSGSLLMLPTIAFSLMYSTLGFPNSAFAGFVVLGAYVGYVLNVNLGLPFLLAVLLTGVALAPLGVIIGKVVFRQFYGQSLLAPMIAGVGVFMVLENAVRFIWGNQIRGLDIPLERPWLISGIHIGPSQITVTLIAAFLILGVIAYIKYTFVGRCVRAVADDPELAEVRGINSHAIIRVVWIITSGLAGVAGVLIANGSVITPLIAWQVVLPMFAAALLGGVGSIGGAAIGALTMGVITELSVQFLPPTYKTAVAFLVMVVILLFRPQGLFRVRL